MNNGGIRPELFANLATAYRAQNNTQDALTVLMRGAQLNPEHAPIWIMLGAVLRVLERYEEARSALSGAIDLAPQNPDAHLEMARLAQATGENDRADEAYRQTIALTPSVVAHSGYATFLTQVAREEDALEQYRAALNLDPKAGSVLTNLGYQLYTMGRVEDSIDAFDRSLALDPETPDTHALRAFPLLLNGDYTLGWKEYEWRLESPTFPQAAVRPTTPAWNGEPLDGKTILLIAEQGYGDTFQFVRYAKPLAERGARVLVTAQRPAVELLKSALGVDAVYAFEDALPAHDYHIHMMSLPHRFDTTLKTLPAAVPYLSADPDHVLQWRDRLVAYGGRKVGIVWSGNPDQRNNLKRSCPLSALASIANVKGISLFSLAKDRDLAEGNLHPGMIDLGPDLKTFSDTAAIMANLDLVISVCTSTVHLSGALARPTWVMLAAASDWRWGLEGEDCPWYPTARLFRQQNLHDWPDITARIAAALADWVATAPR